MLRLLLACSKDNFLARDANDDMRWTGLLDKQVFKLLTITSTMPLLAGRRTAQLLPTLAGRQVVSLSRTQGTTLEQACRLYPDAWLIGGPTVALDAARHGFLTQVVLCQSEHELGAGYSAQPLLDELNRQGFTHAILRVSSLQINHYTMEAKCVQT